MATIYRCDRCLKECESVMTILFKIGTGRYIDLCKACEAEFENWLFDGRVGVSQ